MADRGDEVFKDMLASLAGVAVVEACGGPKRIASIAGIHPSNGSRWAAGDRANPVFRVLGMLDRAAHPFELVALFIAKAARRMIEDDALAVEWRWRAAYNEALRAEQAHDGREDEVTVALLTGHASVADQFAVDQKIIAALVRRVALGFIGMQYGFELNPPKAH